MNKKAVAFFYLAILHIFFVLSVISVSRAQSEFIVVKVGDWGSYTYSFKYDTFFIHSNGSLIPRFESTPLNLLQIGNITIQNVTVTSRHLNVITVNVATSYLNGTIGEAVLTGDVISGPNAPGNLSYQLIPAGLQTGSPIYLDSPLSINETSSKFYAQAERTVNRIFLDSGQLVDNEGKYGNYSGTDVFWDRETGFLCEIITVNQLVLDGNLTLTRINTKIDSTNLWEPGDGAQTWTTLLVLSVAIAFFVVVLYYLRRRRQTSRRKTRVHRIKRKGVAGLNSSL